VGKKGQNRTTGSTTDGLSAVLRWLKQSPPGTLLSAHAIAERLESAGVESVEPTPAAPAILPPQALLWTLPADTRVNVSELAGMMGRPKSYVHRHTAKNGSCARIPHRRLDGVLTFVLSEVRDWIKKHEVVVSR